MLAISSVLVGCAQDEAGTGGEGAPPAGEPAAEAPPAPADDEEAIGDVVTTYLNALADRDFATACEQLSPRAQQDVGGLEAGSQSCAETMEGILAGFPNTVIAKLRDVPITSVEITGDTATVTIQGGRKAIPLERVDGGWLISTLAIG